jgi:serine/threonine protein kinase
LSFFRANETVYMVMKYERGKTLQRHIQEIGGEPMRESYLRGIFIRLLNGLREVHANRLLHLDIKPSNIYIRSDASPVLIDFGAARQALSGDVHGHAHVHARASLHRSSIASATGSGPGRISTPLARVCMPVLPRRRRRRQTSVWKKISISRR